MISALQKGSYSQDTRYTNFIPRPGFRQTMNRTQYVNPLDSSMIVKRGKESERAKNKKKSTLKKIILREREEKRKQKETMDKSIDIQTPNLSRLFSSPSDYKEDLNEGSDEYTEIVSPISQASPLSYNPSPYAAMGLVSNERLLTLEKLEEQVKQKIHSRKFREYCNQIVNKDIDDTCMSLLHEIVRFQDRLYHKNPIKVIKYLFYNFWTVFSKHL